MRRSNQLKVRAGCASAGGAAARVAWCAVGGTVAAFAGVVVSVVLTGRGFVPIFTTTTPRQKMAGFLRAELDSTHAPCSRPAAQLRLRLRRPNGGWTAMTATVLTVSAGCSRRLRAVQSKKSTFEYKLRLMEHRPSQGRRCLSPWSGADRTRTSLLAGPLAPHLRCGSDPKTPSQRNSLVGKPPTLPRWRCSGTRKCRWCIGSRPLPRGHRRLRCMQRWA